MTTFAKRKPRIANADRELEGYIAAANVGKSDEDIAALRSTLYGKAAVLADVTPGERVTASDLFEGSPFHGVRATVTKDSAMAPSGVKWAKQRVMVRFDAKIGNRNFFPFPVAGLVKVQDAPVEDAPVEDAPTA